MGRDIAGLLALLSWSSDPIPTRVPGRLPTPHRSNYAKSLPIHPGGGCRSLPTLSRRGVAGATLSRIPLESTLKPRLGER